MELPDPKDIQLAQGRMYTRHCNACGDDNGGWIDTGESGMPPMLLHDTREKPGPCVWCRSDDTCWQFVGEITNSIDDPKADYLTTPFIGQFFKSMSRDEFEKKMQAMGWAPYPLMSGGWSSNEGNLIFELKRTFEEVIAEAERINEKHKQERVTGTCYGCGYPHPCPCDNLGWA